MFDNWEAAAPEANDPQVNWADSSQAYLSNRTQALVNWMDSFFGDTTYDTEQPESILRLELDQDWTSQDGNSTGVKIRGRVHLPNLSNRISLVFSGDEEDVNISEELAPGEEEEDRIGLQFVGLNTKRSRFDYTLGWAAGHPRPGIRYRHQGPIGSNTSYRFTERIQYEHEKNFYSRTQFRLSHLIDADSVINWSSRLNYGERTQGVEWSSQVSLFNRYRTDHTRPIAISYFAGAAGVTRPDSYTSNYTLGFLFRRQSSRDYLFLEFEPSLNYRKLTAGENRDLMWRAVVRLEIALSKSHRGIP